MPGIAGVIRRPDSGGTDHDLPRMIEAMRHTTRLSNGEYRNDDLGVHVGWINHPGAFSDCMPLVVPSGDAVLVFYGESYLDGGSSGIDPTSAKYLLDLYLERGEDFLVDLNGWFSGVLVDLRARAITLFNDRYGMSRVYVHRGREEFLFASEAKSLLAVRPQLRRIEPAAVAESLRFDCVTGNKTLFRDVTLLPSASAWRFQGGVVPQERRYFDFKEWETQPLLAEPEIYPRFAETLSRVVPAYAAEAPNVAVSLTAGLDTRAIVAALDEDVVFPCYTFGGRWGELYDIRTARRIARLRGQPFTSITIGDDFLRGFGDFARRAIYISDGTHNALGAHDVYFNERARQISPIRLTGKFGSEILRTRKLIPSVDYPADLLDRDFRAKVFGLLPPFAELSTSSHPLTRVVTEEIPWHEAGCVAAEQSQLILRTPYMDNALVKLMFQIPWSVRAEGDLQERFVRDVSPLLSRVPTNLGRFVTRNRRMTRMLYLVMRTLFKVEYVYLYATPHWMTRVDRAVEGLGPERLFAGRQKWEGYRLWLRRHFADFVSDTLLSSRASYQEFFQRATVERMVRGHLAGTHNYMNEINRALTLELVYTSLLKP